MDQDVDARDGGTVEPEPAAAVTEGLQLVSAADLLALAEVPLADATTVSFSSMSALYRNAAMAAEAAGDGRALSVYRLLREITQMNFKPEDRAEPYGPISASPLEDWRTMIPDDLRGAQAAVLAEVAPSIKNPGLRALLADIAWLNNRHLAETALLAISSFSESVALVSQGQATLFLKDEKASGPTGVAMLSRACQIARRTGWKEPAGPQLKELIGTVVQHTFDEADAGGFLRIGELSVDYGISDAIDLARRAEAIAQSAAVNPETSRLLWELAARAFRQAEVKDESDRCLRQAAECYVTMAAAADSRGMTAAHWLMKAVKALRHLPGTQERRSEIEKLVREAQGFIADEMRPISAEMDITAIADDTRKTFAGLTLAQAIAVFASLDRSPSVNDLRSDVLKQAEDNPLSALIGMTIHDDEGKVVSQSPGLSAGEEHDASAIQHLIARHESSRRRITVAGAIEPARMVINQEHALSERHFLVLAEMSAFVPAGYEHIFAAGFARFFGGDLISALLILTPQLENSLRHLLKLAAVDTSAIKSDMTQENRILSVMLSRDRSALEKIWGPEIVFEIENLFDFRGGPALRHQVAHGLASTGDCHSPNAIYACWFIFRLCCIPLFRSWQRVVERYADL
jgi:hypothetical protein